MQALELSEELVNDSLVYAGVSEWDSIGHMNLIEHLETMFNIRLDTEDMLAINSYTEGRVVLKKYGVEI